MNKIYTILWFNHWNVVLFKCANRGMVGWHPKIKIKSSIILNYGVNVQYAYSVKCDIFENIISKGIERDVFHVNVKQHTYL
jgi:hypothetical protein